MWCSWNSSRLTKDLWIQMLLIDLGNEVVLCLLMHLTRYIGEVLDIEIIKEEKGYHILPWSCEVSQNTTNKIYSQVIENLSTWDKKDAEWKVVSYKKKSTFMKPSQGCTIFVSKIPDQASARDLWEFFKQGGDIKDISLPRKRDKMNNRIGFVKTNSELEAGRIISILKQFKW